MRGFPCSARTFIPEALMLKRLEQSEQMRESLLFRCGCKILCWRSKTVRSEKSFIAACA